MNKHLCIDCLHFKTKVVREPILVKGRISLKVKRELDEYEEARIYWCKEEQLPQAFFIEGSFIEKKRNKNCKKIEYMGGA